MSDPFESKVEKKIGPLPVWAWGAIIGGALYFVWRRKAKAAAAAATTTVDNGAGAVDPSATDATALDTTGTDQWDPNSALDSYLGADPTNPAYPVGSTSQGVPAPVTNAQWARLSADDLIGKGDDPSLVQTALAKYISGGALSVAEKAIVDAALIAFGSPPEGVQAVTTTPPPGKVTPPPKTAVKFPSQIHKVGATTTIQALVRQYYPNATQAEQNEIVFATRAAQPQYTMQVPAKHEITLVSQYVKD